MILLELFNRTAPVERLDRNDPLHKGGWEEAYIMPLNGEEICFYFVDIFDGRYVFNFGVAQEDGEPWVSHGLTGRGGEFKVFSAAAMLLRDFIERKHPRYIEVSGAELRQSAFYKKALNRASMPSGYVLLTYGDSLVIQREDHSFESN